MQIKTTDQGERLWDDLREVDQFLERHHADPTTVEPRGLRTLVDAPERVTIG